MSKKSVESKLESIRSEEKFLTKIAGIAIFSGFVNIADAVMSSGGERLYSVVAAGVSLGLGTITGLESRSNSLTAASLEEVIAYDSLYDLNDIDLSPAFPEITAKTNLND